jgi:hypothetical protein
VATGRQPFRSSAAEAAIGENCTQPRLEISLSDGPQAGSIHNALGSTEERFRLVYIALLVILLERRAVRHLTEVCASCPTNMGRLGHQVP